MPKEAQGQSEDTNHKFNGSAYSIGDYESFLVAFHNFLLPLKQGGLEEGDYYAKAYIVLDSLCQKCNGRSLALAAENPLVSIMTDPYNWPMKLTFFSAIQSIDSFWDFFNFDIDKNPEECQLVLRLCVIFKNLILRFGLGSDIMIYWPSKSGRQALAIREYYSNDIFLSLADIIELANLRQNKNVKKILSKEMSKLYEEAEKMFGFGIAWCIFFNAFPGETAHNLSLNQWQEIFRAAPRGSEMSRLAWENIKLIMNK